MVSLPLAECGEIRQDISLARAAQMQARDLEGVQIKAVNSVELAVSRGAEVLAYWEQLFRRWPGPSLWSPRPLCRASRRSRFRLSKFMRQVQASGNVFADGSFGIQFEDAKLEPLAEGA
ncbi:unnamed protein product [Effrenium voratum]|nr:unnamed protein product [Effrenium voratum]